MRTAILGLTFLHAMLATQVVSADPVTFRAEQYGCELTIFGTPRGRVEPGKPLTIDLPRGTEYLVECESHNIPVKLYARDYVFSRGDFRNGALPTDVTIFPIAVLPNVIRAAAAKRIDVAAIADSSSVNCVVENKDPKDPMSEVSRQVAPTNPHRIPKGTAVQLTGAPFTHCGNTNLIEVVVDGSKAWFPNRDFAFSHKGKPITLFQPSQDYECCWIE